MAMGQSEGPSRKNYLQKTQPDYLKSQEKLKHVISRNICLSFLRKIQSYKA